MLLDLDTNRCIQNQVQPQKLNWILRKAVIAI